MKKTSFDKKIYLDDQGEFKGICLGYDYAAEHEWGIKDLREKLSVSEENIIGNPSKCFFLVNKEEAILGTAYLGHQFNDDYDKIKTVFFNKEKYDDFIAKWDDGDFLILGSRKYLEPLWEAITKNDCIVSLVGSGNPFGGSGLAFFVGSKCPEVIEGHKKIKQKQNDLEAYLEANGLNKLFEEKSEYKKAKYFLACSPKWIDYDDEENREALKAKEGTSYDVQYWVNYSDDDDHYGWHTAEEIIEWRTTDKKLKDIHEEKQKLLNTQ